jgi:hypothetical protein
MLELRYASSQPTALAATLKRRNKMLHKTLLILTLLSVGCTRVAAVESDSLILYPVETEIGACDYQLKDTKDPKIKHLVQSGICLSHDAKGHPLGVENCKAVAILNINNNQMALRRMSIGGYSSGLYQNNDYVAEIEISGRDCEKVSCEPFFMDAVVTLKNGSLQETFEMHGGCDHPN